jgi:hypothetical protein
MLYTEALGKFSASQAYPRFVESRKTSGLAMWSSGALVGAIPVGPAAVAGRERAEGGLGTF